MMQAAAVKATGAVTVDDRRWRKTGQGRVVERRRRAVVVCVPAAVMRVWGEALAGVTIRTEEGEGRMS
jgi:hypothetical protein